MANEKIIAQDVFQQAVKDILIELVNSTYSWESYSDEEIGNLVELDPTQVAELSAVISDTQVAKNKVFSSFHTKELIQQSVIEANKYTDDLVANLSNIKLDIVDSLPDSSTVNKSTIYILKDSTGGTNNTLNVWSDTSSAFVEVGKLSVNMDNYYTKSEVDTLLSGKANADEVLKPDAIVQDLTTTSGTTVLSSAGLQTELDKKIDKSAILSSISATPSDEKVLSEKATKTELDKMLLKTSISTSIGDTPSDEKVLSEKAVYENAIKDKNLKTYTDFSQLGLTIGSETLSDIATNMANGSTAVLNVHSNCNVSEYPIGYGVLVVNKSNINRVSFIFSETGGASSIRQWFASYNNGKINGWKKVCATSVADVTKTNITFSDETNYSVVSNSCVYYVLDGVCNMMLYVKCNTPAATWSGVASVPKANGLHYYNSLPSSDGADNLRFIIETGGALKFCKGTAGKSYLATFSYPVAES